MSTTTAPKTFRARSLTDALAQVRDELGPMWNQYTGERPPTAVGRSAA